MANATAAVQTLFINTPAASNNGNLNEIWGSNFGVDSGVRMATNNSWQCGPYSYNFDNSTALNGGALQPSNVSFTPGHPQVIEAVASGAEGGSNSLGWYANYDGPPWYSDRGYTGLIGEVLAYSGTLTAAQAARSTPTSTPSGSAAVRGRRQLPPRGQRRQPHHQRRGR